MKLKIGFAICASFCTIKKSVEQIKVLVKSGHKIIPIMSDNAYKTDTRFFLAKDIVEEIENLCKNKVLTNLTETEPIGPCNMTDIMVVAPCTSNTLSKFCIGITNNALTLSVKSHLRRSRPVVIAFASNDALSSSAQNLGRMLNTKNIYFVPMSQDDPLNKPNSLVAHFDLIPKSIDQAIKGKQIQPIFLPHV